MTNGVEVLAVYFLALKTGHAQVYAYTPVKRLLLLVCFVHSILDNASHILPYKMTGGGG